MFYFRIVRFLALQRYTLKINNSVASLNIITAIYHYTRYFVGQSGVGGSSIGRLYKASFRVQRGNGLGSFLRGLFGFVKPLYSGAKAVGREALSTGFNILTDILNKDPGQPVETIFKKRFAEAKGNLQQKIKNMTGNGLNFKRKRKSKTVQSLSKRAKVKDFPQRSSKGVLKIGARYFP
jgi:hypothetical protein